MTKDLNKSKRRVNVIMKGGRGYCSEWYTDSDVAAEELVNCTEDEVSRYNRILEENNLREDDVETWFISRKQEDEDIYISEHAFKRMKERCGLSRKAALRHVNTVVDNGQDIGEVKGYLSGWAKKKENSAKKDNHFIIYGNYVYIFDKNILVTVIHTPQKGKVAYLLK